jgi:SRSO17 transposase
MESPTVTADTAVTVRRNLDGFLKQFDDCIGTRPSRAHLRTYVGGQIGGLPRKSIEPMALEADVAPRTLQEFMGLHRWDHDAMRGRVQQLVMRDHADESAIALIDETSVAKKGDKTAGVQRQHCGASGKTDNCVVTVHLGYAAGEFAALLDGDLYMPEESWSNNAARRDEAGIPKDVVYRPKWRIALDLLERSLQNGVRFKYLVADEFYGRAKPFRDGAAAMGLRYVVEIPCNIHGWTKAPRLTAGRKGNLRLAGNEIGARRVDGLWLRGGPSWEAFHIKDTEKGPVVWDVRSTPFFPKTGRLPGAAHWLLVARNVLTGELKYFLSNAPAGTPVEALLNVAFSRAIVEQLFENAKSEIGFDHFEVRHYLPLQRHLVLSAVSLLFLMEQAQKLRGGKPLVERGSSPRDSRSAA